MPIKIKPKPDESKDDFIGRCMGNKEVRDAALNRSNSQKKLNKIARAICESRWESK